MPLSDPDPLAYRLAAVEFAITNGWSLIPLNGKVPTLKNWPALTPTAEQMRAWARAGNVGLRTGSIYVIDRDRGGDVTPLNLPDTLQVETGSGGMHYYFSTDLKLPNTAGKLGAKIDTRGVGGQVVYPGSIHPTTGRMYRWATDHAVVPLPPEIISRLTARPVPVPSRYARAALEKELAAVLSAPPHTHNDTLNRAAFALGQLVGGGQLDQAEVQAALLRAARCNPKEAQATVASGLAAGIAQPRRPPGRPREHAPQPARITIENNHPTVLVPGPYETDEAVYGEVGTHDFVRAVLEAIPDSDIYVRAGVVGELSGPPGEVTFRSLTSRRMQTVIDANVRLTQWLRPRAKNALPEQKYVACTRDLAETVLASVLSFGRFRRLEMLVNYPVYLPGWRLAEPGWNAGSRVYYDRPPELASLVPTTDEKVIRSTLQDLVIDFPFDSESSRQNFYGLLLTPLLRPALTGNAPLHLVEASIERAGKSKLIEQVLGRIVTGRPVPAMQYQESETDRDKTILSLLLCGATIIHLDNLAAFVDSAALSSLVTAASYRGRILGQSATAEVTNTFTIIASGNNVRMSSELVKRTVPIMLRPPDDHPEYRTDFTHPDLAAHLTAVRPKVLSCLIGAVERWNRVPLDELPLGGFESWAGAVGGILWTAGLIQWRRSTDSWRAKSDLEGEDLHLLIDAWASRGAGEWTAEQVFSVAEELDLFSNYRVAKTREANLVKFGIRVLKRYDGRPISGYMITRCAGTRRGKWMLETLKHT